MQQNSKEITALLTLIDDPDEDVFGTVAEKLLHYGREIIPNLEQLWEVTIDESVQERIEFLIHRVHFQDLQQEFFEWSHSKNPELLRGAILIAKYQFPDLHIPSILSQFDQIRRNIWLELNSYLTPLEQVNVFNSILYNYYKMQGHELTEREPKYFFINQVLESKQGNAYSLGILYLSLCELLDIPIFAVDIPRQFVFAYIDTLHHFLSPPDEVVQQTQFYIDPMNGMVYTQKDVDAYLRKINARDRDNYFTPLLSKRIIYKMLEELNLCYKYKREEEKAEEIQQLMNILVDNRGE
ncbi:transglutaminase family protein [Polluticoccus soli]|uniref:transglutaminase family protein n=1 Tax=Polluticoccus soli TaxID=3034150 RepID=UPI0023E2F881|nr:transglutaminase family protein [Flavipsychrobacter sp. JY13-12]